MVRSSASTAQPVTCETAHHRPEEVLARHPPGGPVIRREHAPEVAKRGRSEERIGDRMEDDVTVGVAVQPRDAWNLEPTESKRGARTKRVCVDARTDPSVLDGQPRTPQRGQGRRAGSP